MPPALYSTCVCAICRTYVINHSHPWPACSALDRYVAFEYRVGRQPERARPSGFSLEITVFYSIQYSNRLTHMNAINRLASTVGQGCDKV